MSCGALKVPDIPVYDHRGTVFLLSAEMWNLLHRGLRLLEHPSTERFRQHYRYVPVE